MSSVFALIINSQVFALIINSQVFALIINAQVFALVINSQVFALIISSSNYQFTGAFIGLSTLALGDYYAPFTRADIEQGLGHDVRTVCLEHTVLYLPFLAS